MQYRKDKYGNPISILGYGCMRFTRNAAGVDMKKTEKELLQAIEAGVNYFDTAYIYPGSEAALGEILERNGLRDKVKIATKLPHYLIKDASGLEKTFREELRRLRTDHVDYYHMHMLTDVKTWERLKGLGIEDWLRQKQAEGSIRQVGFSYHGNSDMFLSLLEARDWDFCQIQYNYLDENSQAGVTGLKAAAAKGIPVVIMEPLRGGKLANKLPKEAEALFRKYPLQRSPAEWGFRWLWDQEEVTCVLSGMNSPEMVAENCAAADSARAGELTEADRALYRDVVKAINAKMKVGCTGCRYGMPCPRKVDIPGIFAAYNRSADEGYISALTGYFMCTALRRDATGASNCIGCGKCEQHCPQGIAIRKELQICRKKFEGPLYKIGHKLFTTFAKY